MASSSANVFSFVGNLSALDLSHLLDTNDTDAAISRVLEDFTSDFQQSEHVSSSLRALLIGLYVTSIAFGFVSNAAVIAAIATKSAMRTARNYFIVILAVSDLLLCALSMPLTLWDVLSRRWPFGAEMEWLCKLANSFQGTPVFMSSMAIVAIAMDRYRCIMQPERVTFSSSTALLLLALMVSIAIALSVPRFITTRVKPFIEFPDEVNLSDIEICQDTWESRAKLVYTVTTTMAQFVLPFCVVIAIYLSIYFRLRQRPPSQHVRNHARRRRANAVIISITLCFFVLWLPVHVYRLLMLFFVQRMRAMLDGYETTLYAFLHYLGLCNASINPLLYGFMNENFRKEYKNIYRQMPWYSTTSGDGQAGMHLHIVKGSSAMAMMIPRSPLSKEGKEEEEHSKACLVIRSRQDEFEVDVAASSIFRAAKQRRLSLADIRDISHRDVNNCGEDAAPRVGRWRRRMTLAGLGEVIVETHLVPVDSPIYQQRLDIIHEDKEEELEPNPRNWRRRRRHQPRLANLHVLLIADPENKESEEGDQTKRMQQHRSLRSRWLHRASRSQSMDQDEEKCGSTRKTGDLERRNSMPHTLLRRDPTISETRL